MLGIGSTVRYFKTAAEAEEYASNNLYGWYWWIEESSWPGLGYVVATPKGFLFKDGTIQ